MIGKLKTILQDIDKERNIITIMERKVKLTRHFIRQSFCHKHIWEGGRL